MNRESLYEYSYNSSPRATEIPETFPKKVRVWTSYFDLSALAEATKGLPLDGFPPSAAVFWSA